MIDPAPWMHRNALALVNFGGYAILERPDLLAYNEVVPDRVARVLVCGERRHLAYLVDMAALKESIREQFQADLRDQIETLERRLGLA